MPVKFCKRTVNNQVTLASHLKAKINIGERAWQPFIESTNLVEDFAAREHARARHSAAITGDLQLAIWSGMFRRETAKGLLNSSVDTHHNSRMLDTAAPVQQTCADCPSFRSLDVLRHDRKPVCVDRFNTAVEEKKPWSINLRGCVVFGC